MSAGPQPAGGHPVSDAPSPAGAAAICPNCGAQVETVKCKQVCPRCRVLVANCNGD